MAFPSARSHPHPGRGQVPAHSRAASKCAASMTNLPGTAWGLTGVFSILGTATNGWIKELAVDVVVCFFGGVPVQVEHWHILALWCIKHVRTCLDLCGYVCVFCVPVAPKLSHPIPRLGRGIDFYQAETHQRCVWLFDSKLTLVLMIGECDNLIAVGVGQWSTSGIMCVVDPVLWTSDAKTDSTQPLLSLLFST